MANGTLSSAPRAVSVVLFDDFQLLDVFGPVALFGMLPDHFSVTHVAAVAGPIRSSEGTAVLATRGFEDAPTPDIVLVPGGAGTRALAGSAPFLSWLRGWAGAAQLVTSVCTGSALLAAAGLLDGYRATSNKRAFTWVSSFGTNVTWLTKARWVEDRDRWTSAGVAAGMDMTVALIGSLFGEAIATDVTERAELEVHRDPSWDPFAERNGLCSADDNRIHHQTR